MDNNKSSFDKKNIVLIIVIILLVIILLFENIAMVLYLVIKHSSDNKYTDTTWVNSYTLNGIKYKTELEFNNDVFNYRSFKNNEIDFTINGDYNVKNNNIFLEYFNSDEDALTTYSLKYSDKDDYLCFNHKLDCDEEFKFYRSDDDRAFKYVKIEDKYEEEEKEEKEEKEKEEVSPQLEKDVVPTVYVFYGQGCPHCEELFEWINTWNYENEYQLVKYEVWYNESNSALMDAVSDYVGEEAEGVPFIVIGKKAIVGFSKITTPNAIKDMLDEAVNNSKEGNYIDAVKAVSK